MKNVHLLPTDKPSRLGYLTKKGKDVFNNLVLFDMLMPNILDSENQNIYITNDEEIKIDDYYLGEDNNLYCLVTKVNSNGKKIILTTDQELIDESIQPIDDEFLEWFMKNPSCERVEVKKEKQHIGEEVDESYPKGFFDYKIIIPQEEPKQEILEEVAILNCQSITHPYCDREKLMFIKGAKWQEERMYNEEEVLSILNDFIGENPIDVDRWFKQFKKK